MVPPIENIGSSHVNRFNRSNSNTFLQILLSSDDYFTPEKYRRMLQRKKTSLFHKIGSDGEPLFHPEKIIAWKLRHGNSIHILTLGRVFNLSQFQVSFIIFEVKIVSMTVQDSV